MSSSFARIDHRVVVVVEEACDFDVCKQSWATAAVSARVAYYLLTVCRLFLFYLYLDQQILVFNR